MPGGVCAVLDYEVDLMAEYVAEMAVRVVTPNATVTAPFRKFVSQILTSTRLPSTTIMLGMNYLAKRMNLLSMNGLPKIGEGQVWRMLTTALLLGSKFLDDNTFQNKSWSDVSGIDVRELNSLEHEWLGAIGWCLYVNLDKSKDYNAWLKNWQDWQDNKKRQQAQVARERLASPASPIDTDVRSRSSNMTHMYASWHQQQVAEYERLSSMKRNPSSSQSYRPREGNWLPHQPVSWHNAPLTPPDSGYGTPEYLNSATSVNSQYNDWFSREMTNGTHSRQYQQVGSHPGYHNVHRSHANYSNYYSHGQNIWDPSISDCTCVSCAGPVHAKAPSYFMAHGYGQPVMG